jgi:hypothetical protein
LVVPVFTVAGAQRCPVGAAQLEHLRKLYALGAGSRGLEGDLALVRHINAAAAAGKLSKYDLSKRTWAQLTPSEEDLTRSSALKVRTTIVLVTRWLCLCLITSQFPVQALAEEKLQSPLQGLSGAVKMVSSLSLSSSNKEGANLEG